MSPQQQSRNERRYPRPFAFVVDSLDKFSRTFWKSFIGERTFMVKDVEPMSLFYAGDASDYPNKLKISDGNFVALGSSGRSNCFGFLRIIDSKQPLRNLGHSWLIRNREVIGFVLEKKRPAVLFAIARQMHHDPEALALALWLCRKCYNGTFNPNLVNEYCHHSDSRVRKQAIRLSVVTGQWSQADIALQRFPDEKLERTLAKDKPQPFEDRLSQYVDHIESIESVPSHSKSGPSLVKNFDGAINVQGGTPPKPQWWIRYLLERIHAMIRKSKNKA